MRSQLLEVGARTGARAALRCVQATALLGATLLALGCATTARPSPHSPPDTATACAEWRWIGVTRAAVDQCPVVPGWEARPLFEKGYAAPERPRTAAETRSEKKGEAAERMAQPTIADELARFCVYEPKGGSRGRRFPASANHALVRFDQDCAAMGIAGGSTPPLPPEVWKPAAKLFLEQAGLPSAPLEIKNQRGVRLAFLDTEPTRVGLAPPGEHGYSVHGYTLTHIARHLVCSPESADRCAALITTRLALPIQSFDAQDRARTKIDTARGGHVGTQSDLAKAITAEVDAWRQDLPSGRGPRHLVLNLSLGWDPRLFSGLDEAEVAELHAGSQAVYRALQYAASQDVLVLAAAGNKKECPGVPPIGPLLPAAWERNEPRAESCSAAPPPLVYAVGGIASDGAPIWNAREGGMPRRAAYGADAVVSTLDPEQPTAMYTGTSISTAVASSIAAMVWDTLPNLSSTQLVHLLDHGMTDDLLALKADFWSGSLGETALSPSAPKVTRLSLCDAVAVACAQPGAVGCPLPSGSHCAAWTGTAVSIPGLTEDHTVGGTCQPWIFPQPEDPPCPNCIKEPPAR